MSQILILKPHCRPISPEPYLSRMALSILPTITTQQILAHLHSKRRCPTKSALKTMLLPLVVLPLMGVVSSCLHPLMLLLIQLPLNVLPVAATATFIAVTPIPTFLHHQPLLFTGRQAQVLGILALVQALVQTHRYHQPLSSPSIHLPLICFWP